jgi:hypothetical protein
VSEAEITNESCVTDLKENPAVSTLVSGIIAPLNPAQFDREQVHAYCQIPVFECFELNVDRGFVCRLALET